MSHTLKIKRGLAADLSKAGVVDGELKYTKDDNKLYIGDGEKNVLINGITSLVELESENDLPALTTENAHTLFYCKDVEKYFYMRHFGGNYVYRTQSIKENTTFNIDSNQYCYQHALDTDKWYAPSRKVTEQVFTLIEGTITPPGTYEEGRLVLCFVSVDSMKLFKYESGNFTELTNIDYCQGTDVSPSSCDNETYIYCTVSKKLVYFYHTDWTEVFPIKYNSTERPPRDYAHGNKSYVTLVPEYVEVYESIPAIPKWDQLQGSIELEALKTVFEGRFDGKVSLEAYPDYGTMNPDESCMGKLYYCKTYSYYKIANRISVSQRKVATNEQQENDGMVLSLGSTYQEGTLANRPSPGGVCTVYYATDEQKYYLSTTSGSGWGLLSFIWKEIQVNTVSYVPTPSGSNIGYYLINNYSYKDIYEIYGTYEWIDLQAPNPTVQVQPVAGQTYDYDTFPFKRLELYYDEKSVSDMTEGIIYGVIEDA